MLHVQFVYSRTIPWHECELCFIGPSALREGDEFILAIGLFFFEIGVRLWRT